MAIKTAEESAYNTTSDLILPRPLRFYCAPMHSGHWQLRSLISSPRPNILFYPNGRDVVVLNTNTRESYILTTLKFEPRCLTSTNEWLCCGGDKGDYTAIYFGHETRSESCLSQDMEPNARLPFELDPFWRSIPAQRSSKDIRPLNEINKLVGTDIVNCITIWSPSDISSECTYQEPVALVSNNDRTVTILKLENSEVIEKLTLPDCVNRSLMSPEGDMLISICDDPFLYIHKRKLNCRHRKGLPYLKKLKYEWYLEDRVQLEGQVRADPPESRGSFAATFSPSGKYLAIATQHGIITVFEKDRIYAPPISVFTASKMDSSGDGYVRDMEFCPGPFDLLAWTESRDRIGIADVRNFFLTRQVLVLDPNQLEEVEKISINDRSTDSSTGPRRLREESIFRDLADYSGLDHETSSRRQYRAVTRDGISRRAQLRILEPHYTLQRREGSTTRVEASTTPTWRSSIEVRRPISISYTTGSMRSGRPSNAGLPATLREFLSQDRAPSFRSFINDRNREHERRSQQELEHDLEPRRRTTVQSLSSSLNGAETLAEREISRNEDETNVNLERLSLSTSQRRDLDSENLWAGTSLRQRNSTHPHSSDRSSRLRIELEDDDRGEIETRMDELIDFALDAQRVMSGQRNRSQNSILTTMGCCWSQDGKIIYAATVEGIHEFHVNVKGRKLFPRLALC